MCAEHTPCKPSAPTRVLVELGVPLGHGHLRSLVLIVAGAVLGRVVSTPVVRGVGEAVATGPDNGTSNKPRPQGMWEATDPHTHAVAEQTQPRSPHAYSTISMMSISPWSAVCVCVCKMRVYGRVQQFFTGEHNV